MSIFEHKFKYISIHFVIFLKVNTHIYIYIYISETLYKQKKDRYIYIQVYKIIYMHNYVGFVTLAARRDDDDGYPRIYNYNLIIGQFITIICWRP